MTNRDFLLFDTFENPSSYLSGELSDEELEIPPHEIPPNPDDSDSKHDTTERHSQLIVERSLVLPSQVHPSYPYGNPTNIKHPAARPRRAADFSSRALFSDLSYAGGGVNGALRWRDLALEQLLPVDHEREEAARAALARKLASGAASGNNPSQGQAETQHAEAAPQTTDSEEESSDDEEATDFMDERYV